MFKTLVAGVLMMAMSGCVSLQSLSVTQIPKERKKIVKAESSRFIVFAFNFDNDYVNNLSRDLAEQCPGGAVKGIVTKDEAVNYFLWIFHSRRVTATGYCVNG